MLQASSMAGKERNTRLRIDSGLKFTQTWTFRRARSICRKQWRVGMEVVMNKMTNAPELLSRLREVGRCMALPVSAAQEIRIACRALVQTTEAESAEIAAAGLGLAEAAVGDLQDARFNLRIHLVLQTLMARIQTDAESSQAGRVWAAA